MKNLFPVVLWVSAALFCGIDPSGGRSWSVDAWADPAQGTPTPAALASVVPTPVATGAPMVAVTPPGAPVEPPAPGKKWVRPTLKGAEGAGWIQVPDKPAVPKTGLAATAPRGSEIVGDHWHWPDDYLTVLHGERWGRGGRLGTWRVPVRKVP